MISKIIQTSVYVIRLSFASADNIDLGLNNSWYHAQPHPIIAYYCKLVGESDILFVGIEMFYCPFSEQRKLKTKYYSAVHYKKNT
jgi:hypothetical protein